MGRQGCSWDGRSLTEVVLSKQCVDGAFALLVVNWLLLLLVWADNQAASSL